MNKRLRKAPAFLAGWIVFCAFCSWAGWGLSLLHQLNVLGYAVVFALGLGAAVLWWKAAGASRLALPQWAKLRRRYRRLCPLVFLVFVGLTFVAGALYPGNYYDALAYRLPRVLHWLAEGHWHWIHTDFHRVNTRGCGFEWVAAPVLAMFRTDRPLFLVSFICFCLLPGVLFSSFTRMGVNRRVAYAWMWVLPLGACFLLQSGTLGNDIVSALFALAAFDYALRARQSGRIQEVWLAFLAGALATGVKANTLPLLLVWGVVLAPCWRLVWGRALTTAAVGLLALACSFVPTALLNWHYCGDWTGGKAERFQFEAAKPWVRVVGNTELLVLYHLSPPVMPLANYWNQRIAPRLVPARFRTLVTQSFTLNGSELLTVEELQTDGAGLGVGMALLLGLCTVAALRRGPRTPCPSPVLSRMARRLVLVALAIAVLALLKTSFVKSTVRLLCPYYPLMVIPLLLLPGQARVVRLRAWKLGVLGLALIVAVPLVLRPERLLVPAQTLLSTVRHLGWGRQFLMRAEQVYSVYGRRADAFEEVVRALPSETAVLGMVTYDDPETGLWKPFGSRRIVHVCPGDTPQALRELGMHYVLAAGKEFSGGVFKVPFQEWLGQMDGEVVQTYSLALRAGDGPKPWYLVRLR